MGFAPAPAIKKLLKQANLTLEQMDVIELNEARCTGFGSDP